MAVALLFAHAHQTVALQGGEEGPTAAVNELQVVYRGIPGIEHDSTRLELLVADGPQEHLAKMVVLGLAVPFGGIEAVINRPEVTFGARAMHQVDYPDAFHQPMLIAAVLAFDQLDKLRIPLIVDAVIGQQKRLAMVIDPTSHQLPQLARRQPFALQEVTNRVMADALQVLRQIRASVVVRCAQQVLNILLLGNHTLMLSCCESERKPWRRKPASRLPARCALPRVFSAMSSGGWRPQCLCGLSCHKALNSH